MPITSRIQSDFHFKILKDGTKIFYPQGSVGRRGYYVSSPELEPKIRQDLRRFHKRQMLWSAVLGPFETLLAVSLMPYLWAFIVLICFSSYLVWLRGHLYFAKYTKEMEPAHIANSPIAHWSQWGKSASLASLMGYMLLWLVLIVGCIWLYINDPALHVMLFCIAFFALMSVPGSIAIYSKLYQKKTH